MFDSPHPSAFFEPLIDSEHAAALIQVHPKTLQRYARKGIVTGLRVGKLMARRPEEFYEGLDENAQAQ
jgi:predicted site-specific integrase-resolvase